MDRDCQSAEESTASSTKSINLALPHPIPSAANTSSGTNNHSNGTDQYLRHLNKLSHKISKPNTTTNAASSVGKSSSFESPNQIPHQHKQPLSEAPSGGSQPPSLAHQQQHQPPVYNINKNDFRDVVQKLTGSPAHERISNQTTQPPPIQAPKPASSRLQRIRPPPLEQITNRPPPLMNCHLPPQNAFNSAPILNPSSGFGSACGFMGSVRPLGAPLSPLPPLPSCHASAESPISAYMRFLHSSVSGGLGFDSDSKSFSGMPSPKCYNQTAVNSLLQNESVMPFPQQPGGPPARSSSSSSSSQSLMPPPPSSPLPFGCLPSPKSLCPLLSPNLPFSPTGTGQFGFPTFPLSPGLPPVPSPK